MKVLPGVFFVVFLSVSSVFAQTVKNEEVLAAGARPLTRSMVNQSIEFFEWALEIRLSDTERVDFQKEIVGYWETGNAKGIQGIFSILEFRKEAAIWDADKRRQVQLLIQQRFLNELEKNDSNSVNKLLLAGYRRTHAAAKVAAN